MKKTALFLGVMAFGSLVFSSCSKSDDGGSPGPGTGNQRTYKFTITATGAAYVPSGSSEIGDDFSLILSGGDIAGTTTIWKVNGVTRSNEKAISFGEKDFTKGETYVIESLVPLVGVSGSISAQNFVGAPISFTFTPVVGGTPGAVISETVPDEFLKQLSY